jgi:ubiquinone/menaquinone biosynthesis C-methylase UbiE
MASSWHTSSRQSHLNIIQELLDPVGKKIIDIGCGAGQITRALTKIGAEVTGIDPGKRQLERARAEEPVGDETYLEGVAENLPFDSKSIDIALFFNSFHHVRQEGFSLAIEESHRVLKPGGKLYFAEPIANGPQFELSRLINDETEIRSLAYESILTSANKGFTAISEITYITENKHKDFDTFKINSMSINPARDVIFQKYGQEIKEVFERIGIKNQGFYVFDNPVRGNLYERI